MDGIIVFDKPEGGTSHDAVNLLRRLAATRRVGHLGTLDPIATGVLPLLIGRATRLAQFYLKNDKEYEASVRFGFATDTYDRAGDPLEDPAPVLLDAAALEELLSRFRGVIQQTPPPVSAKKIGGVPAYKLARKNAPVELQPVEVTVHELRLLSFDGATAKIFVRCSSGTYVRSIAHDLGRLAGCGAHVSELRRVASGEFRIERAVTRERLQELAKAGDLAQAIVPASELLPDFPAELVDEGTTLQIRNGRDFAVSPFRQKTGTRYLKAVTRSGELVAIGEAVLPHLYHPVVVL